MTLRVDLVDPLAMIEPAARVLCEAWEPPSIDYDAAYLEWQFTFPSNLPRLAVVARDGDVVVAFAAATPRAVRIGHWALEAVIVSFVAVSPRWRGRGTAALLYDALLSRVRELRVPVITFAEHGSAGERAIAKAYSRAGFERRELEPCEPYACVVRSAAAASDAHTVSPSALVTATDSSSEAGVCLSGDAAQLEHFARDPRQRCFISVTDDDRSIGALAVASRMRTPRGIETIPTIDVLLSASPSAASLRAIADTVSQTIGPGSSRVVVFQNVRVADAEALSAAGIRRMPFRFIGHVCVPPGLDGLKVGNLLYTNVDIV